MTQIKDRQLFLWMANRPGSEGATAGLSLSLKGTNPCNRFALTMNPMQSAELLGRTILCARHLRICNHMHMTTATIGLCFSLPSEVAIPQM